MRGKEREMVGKRWREVEGEWERWRERKRDKGRYIYISRTARYTDGKVETTMKNVPIDFLFLL